MTSEEKSKEIKDEDEGPRDKKELKEDISGSYFGHGSIHLIEIMGKTPLARFPASLVKKKLEADLAEGFDVILTVRKDNTWILDLGEAFAKYQITTIFSTGEGRINLANSGFQVESSFYVPGLRDDLYLTVKGHLDDFVEGTLKIQGDTHFIRVLLLGTFKLIKAKEN